LVPAAVHIGVSIMEMDYRAEIRISSMPSAHPAHPEQQRSITDRDDRAVAVTAVPRFAQPPNSITLRRLFCVVADEHPYRHGSSSL
jgi:hypothetical protein